MLPAVYVFYYQVPAMRVILARWLTAFGMLLQRNTVPSMGDAGVAAWFRSRLLRAFITGRRGIWRRRVATYRRPSATAAFARGLTRYRCSCHAILLPFI